MALKSTLSVAREHNTGCDYLIEGIRDYSKTTLQMVGTHFALPAQGGHTELLFCFEELTLGIWLG